VVVQPVKASSNHKTETRQPKEPRKSPPNTKAKPNSRSRKMEHLFDTPRLSDMESSVSSPEVVPQRKPRIAKGVTKVQLPLSPATSHSPPQVKQSRPGNTKANVSPTSKIVDLSSNNGNATGATKVTHIRGIKRKRVIESDEESESTAKKPKQAIERTPRPKGSTYKTRRNAANANPRPKTPPTSIGADDPEALKAEKVRPLATGKREPEVQPARANTVEETVGGQPETHSSPRTSNGQTRASECERIFEWDAGSLPEIIPVVSILRSKDNLKAPPASPTRQDTPLPMVQISLPKPEPKEAKVTGGYSA